MSLSDIRQIGIVGGGASSLMLCMEAAKMGINTCILDPQVDCLGSRIATEHIVAAITKENVKKLSLRCDRVIYNTRPEFEVDVKLHCKTFPSKENLGELYNFKNILDILEVLEIPTAKIFYQDNNEDAFKELNGLTMPFRFIKLYEGYSKQMDIFNKEDLTDFIMEVDEDAKSFILQPISEYKQIVACICMVDETGKIYQYHPIEETTDGEDICDLCIGDTFTKNMVTKLGRYNKKLLKELNAVGVYTIKYGVKANKAVEFIEITPELGVGSILTTLTYEKSVFEQYMHLLLEMKLSAPELICYASGRVTSAKEPFDKNEDAHVFQCGIANFIVQRESIE